MSLKQPKYFYSRTKELKTLTVLKEAESLEDLASSTCSTPRSYPIQIKIPKQVLFALGGIFLTSLLSLAGYSFLHSTNRLPRIPLVMARNTPTAPILEAPAGDIQGTNFDLQKADARIAIVASFLTRYKSPLTPADHYAKELVAAADRYGLDYRLLPAIMMQESNLCKASKPELKNCFGFGIHARGELGFDTYEAGFDRVAREIKERYINIGLVTPEQIMKKYTPGSNGSWANSVNQWIAEMEHNSREKGLANEGDADLLEYALKN